MEEEKRGEEGRKVGRLVMFWLGKHPVTCVCLAVGERGFLRRITRLVEVRFGWTKS